MEDLKKCKIIIVVMVIVLFLSLITHLFTLGAAVKVEKACNAEWIAYVESLPGQYPQMPHYNVTGLEVNNKNP